MTETKEKQAFRKSRNQRFPETMQGLAKSFSQKNLILFLVALVVIIIGHVALGMGSITFAPICLILGYCILVPLAIIL
jgi:hypothetical protein